MSFQILQRAYAPYGTAAQFPASGDSRLIYRATDTGYLYTWDASESAYKLAGIDPATAPYLGLHAQADDAARLGGQLPSAYVRTGANAVFANLAVRVPVGGADHALLLETSSDAPWNAVINRSDLVNKSWKTFLASDGSYRFYNHANAVVLKLRQDGSIELGAGYSGVLVSTAGSLSTVTGFTGAKVIGGTTCNFVAGLLVS